MRPIQLLLLAGWATLWGARAGDRPNVLFIATDDLRPTLGCYGDVRARTPNLDAFARSGLVFERAYCQQAVCNPSRASLMTGRRPDTLKVWDLKRHFREAVPEARTIPQWFKEHGYHAQAFGKIFHNFEDQQDPPSWSEPPEMNTGPHWKDWVVADKPGEPPARKMGAMQRAQVSDDAYWDGQISAKAAGFLAAADGESPFFLAVGFWKPHLPFGCPEPYWKLYEPESLPRYWEVFGSGYPAQALQNGRELRNYQGMPAAGPVDPVVARRLVHGYYAAVSYVDAQIGRVLEALDRRGLREKTIVVIWSDHGYHLGENGVWCKATNFERDTRVPLLLRVPGAGLPGQRARALVELVDLFPTLCEAAGLPVAPGLEGSSLMPLVRQPGRDWDRAAYSQFPRPWIYKKAPEAMGCSIRTDRWRYTEWRGWSDGRVMDRELYDHDGDPEELHNLAQDPGRKGDLEHLATRLRKRFPDTVHP